MRALIVSCILLFPAAVLQAQATKPGSVVPLADVKFATDDDVKCLRSVKENGDPATGPSTYILKAPPGCLVAWHWHTAEEQLIVTQGSVLTEMEGMAPHTLGPGGFAMMPSKVKHQFSCKSKSDCIMFVTFDRVYDIYWVKEGPSSRTSPKQTPGK